MSGSGSPETLKPLTQAHSLNLELHCQQNAAAVLLSLTNTIAVFADFLA